MKILKMICVLVLGLGLAFPSVFEENTAKQHPLVEEAFRIIAKKVSRQYGQIWRAFHDQKQLEREEKLREEIARNPNNIKAREELESLLKGMSPQERLWVQGLNLREPKDALKLGEPDYHKAIEELKSIERQLSGQQPSQAIVDRLIVNMLGGADLWEVERLYISGAIDWETWVQRTSIRDPQTGAILVHNIPSNPGYIEEMITYFEKAESYDPNLYFDAIWIEDTDEVYYICNWKTMQEYKDWFEEIWKKLSALGKETLSTPYATYCGIGKIYLARGDYEKAIYYLEKELEWWFKKLTELTDIRITMTFDKSLEYARAKYLQQLKKRGEEDKLYPYIHLGGEILDKKFCFTKNGIPYVAVAPLCEVFEIPFKWARKDTLLTLNRGSDTIQIANIKGQWKVYTEEGKKDINAYSKDGELYLPLKELCKLLNLELKWDDDTFIAYVFKK